MVQESPFKTRIFSQNFSSQNRAFPNLILNQCLTKKRGFGKGPTSILPRGTLFSMNVAGALSESTWHLAARAGAWAPGLGTGSGLEEDRENQDS